MRARRYVTWTSAVTALMLVLGACATATPTMAPTVEPTPSATPTFELEDEARPSSEEEPQVEANPISPIPTPIPEMTSPIETPVPPSGDTRNEEPESPNAWLADGIISENEYTAYADFQDIRVRWDHDAEHLYLAMEGDTTGWVSVGINPEQGMQGANYLFGYVENGEAFLWDAYGTAPAGPNHPPDDEIGGTNDILAFAGVEENGVTRFEIKIPLDSGDAYDQTLVPGNSYPIIVAIGGEDDFNGYHLRYDRGELTLTP